MKILFNGKISEKNTKDINALLRRGFRFTYSPTLDAYVSQTIKIHENGESRVTKFDEHALRRDNGECFLKVAGKPIYAPVDADKYQKIMRPIWREERRVKREWDCLYKDNKKSCPIQDCDCCVHKVYEKESVDFMMDNGGQELPTCDDVADDFVREQGYEEMYKAVRNLDPIDLKILLLKADGKSEREIATKLGFKSKTSVQKHMAKALPPLWEHLENFF